MPEHPTLMNIRLTGLVTYCALVLTTNAAVTVFDASTAWTPMRGNYDYLEDQQTGKSSGDIVGVDSDYGFLTTFNDNGTASRTDGNLGFRLRLDAAGGPSDKPAFDRVAWIGIDADHSGSIDAFLGLNLQGSAAEIGIYAPGNGANNSPKTTSISSGSYKSYGLTPANYDYRAVDYLTDGGTSNDLTRKSSGDPDYYVSFMVPFADVTAFLSTKSIQITDQTPLRYVSATSTQTNSLNQDLGGVNGGVDTGTTWVEQNGFTEVLTAGGTLIPEPSSILLSIAPLAAVFAARRRA